MKREHEIFKVTLIGSLVNALLVVFKAVAGIWGHSAAMVADAVHSLSDFVTDIVVLVFVRISSKPQDKEHDYGHGKYETIATTIIGLALMAVAIGIIYQGAQRIVMWLQGQQLPAPDTIALWAALVSVVSKEALYQYTVYKSKHLQSPAMEANAWHHRSDAFSSIGTALGIGGAVLLGDRWTILDPIASVVIGAIIIKLSVGMIKNGVQELTDGSLSEDTEKEILDIILQDAAVSQPHNLRTRRIGNRIAIEVHVRMDGNIILSESHLHATHIEQAIKARFGDNTHITIHLEPLEGTNKQ